MTCTPISRMHHTGFIMSEATRSGSSGNMRSAPQHSCSSTTELQLVWLHPHHNIIAAYWHVIYTLFIITWSGYCDVCMWRRSSELLMNMRTAVYWNEVEFVLLQCWAWRCHGDELQMLVVVVDFVRRQWWLQWRCSDQDCLRELTEDQQTKERNYKSYEERGCKRCEKHFCPLICDTGYVHTRYCVTLHSS